MTDFFDNQRILNLIWKWRKQLLIVGVLATVLSALFSSPFFITPKYRSTARIYPTHNIYIRSEESETEQLLEIIASQDIALQMFDAFDLPEVYTINRNDRNFLTYMMAEYTKHVSFKKTDFETVEIRVLDKDPQRASDMCDSLIVFCNNLINSLQKEKLQEVLTFSGFEREWLTQQIDSVHTAMVELSRNYQILDFETQVKELTRGYMNVLGDQKQNSAGGQTIERLLKNFAEKGTEYQLLQTQLRNMTSQRDSVKRIYESTYSSMLSDISYCQIIQKPVPADKKAYPVRWLIVFLSVFASVFVASLVILLLENKKTN